MEGISKYNIVVKRGEVWDFDALLPGTIALDGAVRGPRIDTQKQVFSFDHHENCIRHSTRSTCEQVLDALLLGLEPACFSALVNDIDGDTVLSVWLLLNPDKAKEIMVQYLTRQVGLLDSYGPAYPVGVMANDFHNHVMGPVNSAKRAKTYGTDDLQELLQACLNNMDNFMANDMLLSVEHIEENKSYEIVHKWKLNPEYTQFVIVKSSDFIFDKLYQDGYRRAVAFDVMPDGSYAYTIGKKSEFVPSFPVRQILDELNIIEPGWGGGSTIGGAPRNADGSRSRIEPERLFTIIKDILER